MPPAHYPADLAAYHRRDARAPALFAKHPLLRVAYDAQVAHGRDHRRE